MEKFGKKAPYVGFAIYADDLMSAISRNKIPVEIDYSNVLVLYDYEQQKEAINLACQLRSKEQKVELIRMSKRHDIQEYVKYGKNMHFSKLIYFEDAEHVRVFSLSDDMTKTVLTKELGEYLCVI